jgi:SAM-dependent methyltransferase
MTSAELARYCNIIRAIAGPSLDAEKVSTEIVRRYYQKSSFFYRKFHSPEGAMHLPMALREGASHQEKLRYQADYVNSLIREHNYHTILELGCGQGFNSNYLALLNPDLNFTGLDITEHNLRLARRNARGSNNVVYRVENFDQLPIDGKRYDLIFGVETLCHSENISRLIASMADRLNAGGRIVIFDGYVKPDAAPLTNPAEAEAYQLLSWGFALTGFQPLTEVLKAADLYSLSIEKVDEYSENVLPNYIAFQRGAQRALQSPRLLRFLLKIRAIPMALIRQFSAGLFGPHFIRSGYLGYYLVEFTLLK